MDTNIEDNHYLWKLSFALFDSLGINPEAMLCFDKEINGHIWVLHETGLIVSKKIKNLLEKVLVIDEDPVTKRSINLLPLLYYNALSSNDQERFSISLYDHNDNEWKDAIIIRKGRLALRDMCEAWANKGQLDNLVDRVSRSLT